MAYASRGSNDLQNAMLRVWTPVVGVRSWNQVHHKNAEKLCTSLGFYAAFCNISDIWPYYTHMLSDDYFDDEPPFEIKEKILSGSWSEGLFFYGHSNTSFPDVDFMYVLKHISFTQEDQQSGMLTLKEDTPFVYAYLTERHAVTMWEDFLVEHAGRKRLSSRKLKERLHENCEKSEFILPGDPKLTNVGDGAAMYINKQEYLTSRFNAFLSSEILTNCTKEDEFKTVMTHFYGGYCKSLKGYDVVLAISCDGWPSCAREWITRDRNWPQDDLIKKIIDDGFHIVPKSSTEGDFRLSFSYAETTLIENLTELQHKILRSFKAVVKYYQNTWSPNIKEILTTYHLKTIAFWYFENTYPDCFTQNTLATHLILLLQNLAKSFRNREIPMYFMPKVNLFKDIENLEEVIDIAEQIELLSSDFSLLIKGVENITGGSARQCCIINNLFRLALETKQNIDSNKAHSSSLQHDEKNSTGLINDNKNRCELRPQKSESDDKTIERMGFKKPLHNFDTSVDTETFLDLD